MAGPIPQPFVCPSCHGVLLLEKTSLSCAACSREFSTDGGTKDFSLQGYYDSFDPEQDLPPENLIGLMNEEDGIRTRVKDYYLPIIKSAYGNNWRRAGDSVELLILASILIRLYSQGREVLGCTREP